MAKDKSLVALVAGGFLQLSSMFSLHGSQFLS